MGWAAAENARARRASVVEGATEMAQQCVFLALSELVGSVPVSGEHWGEFTTHLAS